MSRTCKTKHMAYFNYHAKIKKLIYLGELTEVKILTSYNRISPCMLLIFKSYPPMPVREYKWEEYFFILNSLNYKYKFTPLD